MTSTSTHEQQPGQTPEPQSQQQPSQPAAAPDRNAAAADCAALLKQTFPALFAGGAKPLKLRIQADIQERAPGQFTKQALSAFLRRYTGGTSYLVALTKSPHRFDLDGNPAGEISEEHRKAASDELARRRANRQAREQLEEDQRRNREQLLRDFERTTLTPANFCALKGVAQEELEGLLELARREAQERSAMEQRRPFDDRRGPRRDGRPPQGRAHQNKQPHRGPGRAPQHAGAQAAPGAPSEARGAAQPAPARGDKGKQAR